MDTLEFLSGDVQVDPADIAQAQGSCALALGRLDGLLTGLTKAEERLFCWALLRSTLLHALRQAGFEGGEQTFDSWFVGIGRAPQETALTACPAHTLLRAILRELGHHPWPPLAHAAHLIGKIGRFAPDRAAGPDDDDPAHILAEAARLVSGSTSRAPGLPFHALGFLASRLRESSLFAPGEHERAALPWAGQSITVTRLAPRTPLWAVDCSIGGLIAAAIGMRWALPFPGAITEQALRGGLPAGERAICLANALHAGAERHIAALLQARTDCRALEARVSHLRASARAPEVWMALRGFAPLGLEQVGAAFGISRRGTYAVIDALIEAGLARRATVSGRVVLSALPATAASAPPPEPLAPLPSPVLADIEAAIARADQLLDRSSEPNQAVGSVRH